MRTPKATGSFCAPPAWRRAISISSRSTALIDRRNDEPMIFAPDLDADPERRSRFPASVDGDEPSVDAARHSGNAVAAVALDLDGCRPGAEATSSRCGSRRSTQNDWLVPLCRAPRRQPRGRHRRAERDPLARACVAGGRVRRAGADHLSVGLRSRRPVDAEGGGAQGRVHHREVRSRCRPATDPAGADSRTVPRIPAAAHADQGDRAPQGQVRADLRRRRHRVGRAGGAASRRTGAAARGRDRQLARPPISSVASTASFGPAAAPEEDRPNASTRSTPTRSRRWSESFNEITEQFARVASEFDDWEEEASELWQTIAAEIEEKRPDLSDVEVPRSEAPGETDRFVLFNSRRDYFTQMDAYNAWRDGDEQSEGEP